VFVLTGSLSTPTFDHSDIYICSTEKIPITLAVNDEIALLGETNVTNAVTSC